MTYVIISRRIRNITLHEKRRNMYGVKSITMLDFEDLAALRLYLRSVYLTEHRATCHALLSLAYQKFELQCMSAMRGDTGSEGFCARLPDGIKLEYSFGRIEITRAWLALPTVTVEVTRKRVFDDT